MNNEVLILGSDQNAYYMARCLYEAFHKKAYLIGQRPLAFTTYSSILNVSYEARLWEEDVFLKCLDNFSKDYTEKIILISTNETYTKFISKNKDRLKEKFLFNVADERIIDSLIDKEKFYKTYKDSVLTFPKTLFISKDIEIEEKIEYPVVLKPSDVRIYNHINFDGKKKVYKINSQNELIETIKLIRDGGYDKTLILQEFIPGGDDALFDAIIYANSTGSVQFMSFAQIGLQERTGGMVGNPVVLMNGVNTTKGDINAQAYKLKKFIESVGYTGFAGVDMKYDYRTNTFKVLEINARQTRQGYYLSGLGKNLVKVLVDDLIYEKKHDFQLLDKKVLLSFVSKRIAKKYITNDELKREVLNNWKNVINPMKSKDDKNFLRRLLLMKKDYMYFKDYKNSYWR